MTRQDKVLSATLIAFAIALGSLLAMHSRAADSGYQSGMAPDRKMALKLDRFNGTPINGIYVGSGSAAGATTAAVTLTGASNSAKLLASKTSAATATYIKGVTISNGTATVTFSGSTTDSVCVVAIDTFADPLTF